ncbi:META domain-containing protein [Candidatus Peregrinibacteria bacterium]|nr:META domain-containing protein [Candidatus Peregrinibacteria bacterium]
MNKKFLVLVLSALFMTGCSQFSAGVNQTPSTTDKQSDVATTKTSEQSVGTLNLSAQLPSTLDGQRLTLVKLNGKAVSTPYGITFQEGKLSTKICNQMNGPYTFENGVLKASSLVSTKMACLDEETNKIEGTVARVLGEGLTVTVENSVFSMKAKDGTELTYTTLTRALPQGSVDAAAGLEGKSFVLSKFDGKAVEDTYTLSFAENNTFSVKFCNGIGGTYSVDDNTIKGNGVSTLMYCMKPDGVMVIEDAFNKAISAGATFSLIEGTLTLKGSEGAEFVFASSADGKVSLDGSTEVLMD